MSHKWPCSPLKCLESLKNSKITPHLPPKSVYLVLRVFWPYDFRNQRLIKLLRASRDRMGKNAARKIFVWVSFRRFSWFGQNTWFAIPNEVRVFFQIFFKWFLNSMIADHISQFVCFCDPWNHPGGPKWTLRDSVFLKTGVQEPLKSQNQVYFLIIGNKWNPFDPSRVEIGLVEDIKPWQAPFLRDIRAWLRGSRVKVAMRVERCFKQASWVLWIHMLTLKIGQKHGVLPLPPYSPT